MVFFSWVNTRLSYARMKKTREKQDAWNKWYTFGTAAPNDGRENQLEIRKATTRTKGLVKAGRVRKKRRKQCWDDVKVSERYNPTRTGEIDEELPVDRRCQFQQHKGAAVAHRCEWFGLPSIVPERERTWRLRQIWFNSVGSVSLCVQMRGRQAAARRSSLHTTSHGWGTWARNGFYVSEWLLKSQKKNIVWCMKMIQNLNFSFHKSCCIGIQPQSFLIPNSLCLPRITLTGKMLPHSCAVFMLFTKITLASANKLCTAFTLSVSSITWIKQELKPFAQNFIELLCQSRLSLEFLWEERGFNISTV